jgi:hypothetical protein
MMLKIDFSKKITYNEEDCICSLFLRLIINKLVNLNVNYIFARFKKNNVELIYSFNVKNGCQVTFYKV